MNMPKLLFIEDLEKDSAILKPCHGKGLTTHFIPENGILRLQCLKCGKHVADIAVAYHEPV
jgi:hypothetical protein